MNTRKLGNSDLLLTTVGLGTWAIGGPWQYGWGPQDDDQAIKAIIEALDECQVNWIDTAPIYGCGHSEQLIGKAIKLASATPIIATKCSLLWNNKREKISCLKADSIRRECEDSLKRLDIDVIDLYQVHWPQPEEDLEQAAEALAKLLDQGKIRYVGVSNFTIEHIERFKKIVPVTSLQPQYSMIHRQIEDGLLDYCGKNGIGIVAYSPMAMGLLTGKFDRERFNNLPKDDVRRKSPDFQPPKFDATLELVDRLKDIANRNGRPLAQLAIAWVLRKPEVTSAIVGARKPGQMKETAHAMDWLLKENEIEEIEELLQDRNSKINK